jgi:hypothetical protein
MGRKAFLKEKPWPCEACVAWARLAVWWLVLMGTGALITIIVG